MKQRRLIVALFASLVMPCFGQSTAPYQNPDLTPERRAADLVGRMTLEERILQMQNSAPAIPRLDVPVYNWWNEALHGVATGRATVFPQAIALGSTWDPALVHRIAEAISTEARAKRSITRPNGSRQFKKLRQVPLRAEPPGSPTGRRTSTSFAIRAGDGAGGNLR